MRAASPALIALLDSGVDFQMVDLWTITLNGGSVVRWSGADIPIVSGGQTFARGPIIEREQISEKIGLEVATMVVDLTADSSDLINGVPLIPFIARRGLDGANVRIDRAFMADWNTPVVGSLLRFSGRVTSLNDIGGNTAKITVSSWMILLNANMPANLYQTACLHSVYDAGCTLNPASFTATGTITGTPTATAFASGLSTVANDYAQGRILFTSGANNGLTATVKSNDGSGNFQLIVPLPNAPAAGDTFTAYPGCDLSQSRCNVRFNNLTHFKATPFVPVPETAFG